MQRIAIDLLWLRPGKVGGTESYIRNLLDGFLKLEEDYKFVLIASLDNEQTFRKYLKDKRFEMIVVGIESANIGRRIIWQTLHQNRLLRRNGIKYCFTPVYCRPVFNGGIQYINTIHDIQAYHFPEYHPFYEVLFSKMNWVIDKYFSKHIIAISHFVKRELVEIYHIDENKISVIYNPIKVNMEERCSFEELQERYHIEKNKYFYSVSQLIPHKNFETLLEVFYKIKNEKIDVPCKLIVSGINGNASERLKLRLMDLQLEDVVIMTGFISNQERNTLYENCKAFLFPSVFEGFGMTAIEAMYFGRPVITTMCASIPEVTQLKANYVEDPYNVDQWIDQLISVQSNRGEVDFQAYDEVVIGTKYLEILREVFGEEVSK